MPVILLLVLLPLVIIGLTPWLPIQRYRAGSARRVARKWTALLTIVSTMMSYGGAARCSRRERAGHARILSGMKRASVLARLCAMPLDLRRAMTSADVMTVGALTVHTALAAG